MTDEPRSTDVGLADAVDAVDAATSAEMAPAASTADIEIFAANEQNDVPIALTRWESLARRVLVAEGVDGEVEMSLLFIDEQSISALNERFMGKAGPTDVLSFPIDEEAIPGGRSPDGGTRGPGSPTAGDDDDLVSEDEIPLLLGDVVICPAVAERNAAEHRSECHDGSLDDELALLVVHGILHLLGLDHDDDTEAEEMEAREQELLGRFYRVKEASA